MPAVATVAGLPNRLGKYELLMPLAAGGMARIYIGRSTGIGSFERHVVLKLITPERANDQTAVQMFLDEARLAASLNHQNVAQVFEVGEDAGIHYLAMEYVHGQDLRALLAKAGSQGTRIPLDLALTTVAGAAAGLHHAHERRGADGIPLGIVHRDVSPSNIMIGYDGSVKLLDFGIAKATSRSVETQSGIIKGKFAYMAPEQCRGRDVDRRSDVFSLGIILYEISTQHRCFRADSDFDTMHRIVTGDVVRPTRLVQGYPQALEAIVMKALAVDAAQRYASAGHLLEAIESFSIASRMSLSTMGLGRFMRDMFGEQQEPWLGAPQDAPVSKENTISSTDGRSDVQPAPQLSPRAPIVADAVPQDDADDDDDDDAHPDSGGIAATTVMNPSRPRPAANPEDWRSFGVEPLRPTPTPKPRLASSSEPPTTPSITPIPSAFVAAPPSGTGPSLPLPSTRHGYAGGAMTAQGLPAPANDLGYPLYEPPAEPDVDVQIRLRRGVLYVGLGVVALGIVAIVALVAGGGSHDDSLLAGKVGSDPAAAVVAPTLVADAQVDDYVALHIASEPKGADVLIAETKVGTTPYDGKLRRGTALASLVIHMDGFSDYKAKIDLSGEYSNDKIKLAKLPEVARPAPVGVDKPVAVDAGEPETGSDVVDTAVEADDGSDKTVKPIQHNPRPHPPAHPAATHTSTPTTPHATPPAAKPKCQPAASVNPFDTSCDGKACPPCK